MFGHRRKTPGGFYARPGTPWRELLWLLGYDPLTVRERLAQVERERDDYRRWGDEFAGAVWSLFGDHRDELQAEKWRLRREGGFDMTAPPVPRYRVVRADLPLLDHPGGADVTPDDDDGPDTPWEHLGYWAWTILANAGGGDWSRESPEWQAAVVRWRDRFHELLTERLAVTAAFRYDQHPRPTDPAAAAVLDATDPAEAVFLALGAASACWETLEGAGVFESDRAQQIGRALCLRLGIETGPAYGPPLAVTW